MAERGPEAAPKFWPEKTMHQKRISCVSLCLALSFRDSLCFMTSLPLLKMSYLSPSQSRYVRGDFGLRVSRGPHLAQVKLDKSETKLVAGRGRLLHGISCMADGGSGQDSQIGEGHCVHFINLSNGKFSCVVHDFCPTPAHIQAAHVSEMLALSLRASR